jgi:hypothetical protein
MGPSPNVYSICSTASDTGSETPMKSNDRPPDINTSPAPATPRTSTHATHNELAGSRSCSWRAPTIRANCSGSSLAIMNLHLHLSVCGHAVRSENGDSIDPRADRTT